MSEVLTLKHVSKTFNPGSADQFLALDDVNLKVNQGDFITIVGGNGAGKSTLLNAIAGTFMTDEGNIILDGQDITFLAEEERASDISRVFQDPKMGTAPRMTVAENLGLAEKRGEPRGLRFASSEGDRERYAELLKPLHMGLENRLDAEMGTLSGGQRQAVALLMATLKTPKILLLDEHTAALDPKATRKILELTNQQVEEQHLTALMVTHNMTDALTYGNRMIVMNQGKIIHDYEQDEKSKVSDNELFEMIGELEETD